MSARGKRPPAAAYLVAALIAFVIVHSFIPFDLRTRMGFKSFELESGLTPKMILYSVTKWRHIVWFALFFPVIRSLFKERASMKAWWTVLAVSVAIELQQGFIAGRYARATDLLPNVIGASLGWWLWSKLLLRRFLDQRGGS